MNNYNSTIQYYRINANNRALATSNSGGAENAPTEEIAPPVKGCTYSSGSGSPNIVGVAIGSPASDFNDFQEGQYLYYVDGSTGDYVLMGQIDEITSITALVLTASSTGSPTVGAILVASSYLVSTVESFYIRIATSTDQAGTNRINLPRIASWRSQGSLTSLNNQNITQLEQISNSGFPIVPASPAINIPFTITTRNVFSSGTTVNTYWATPNNFPAYIWIEAVIATGQEINALASKTMFRFTTEEFIPEFNVGVNTPVTDVLANGYNIPTSTNVVTNPPPTQ
jgi:hypothetical protein